MKKLRMVTNDVRNWREVCKGPSTVVASQHVNLKFYFVFGLIGVPISKTIQYNYCMCVYIYVYLYIIV